MSIQPNVEVPEGKFSLADVLAPGVCPKLHRLASLIPLGRSPLPGSARVFTGEEIRARFEDVLPLQDRRAGNRWATPVPDRVTVKRTGARATCAGIARSLAGVSSARGMAASAENFNPSPRCGAAGDGMLQPAALTVAKTRWNAQRGVMEITARCLQPGDCTPFIVTGQLDSSSTAAAEETAGPARPTIAPARAIKDSMVRPGQSMTLLWDQDGIQMLLRVICLDRGDLGETVRARVQPGERVLRATVIGAETLRMQP